MVERREPCLEESGNKTESNMINYEIYRQKKSMFRERSEFFLGHVFMDALLSLGVHLHLECLG